MNREQWIEERIKINEKRMNTIFSKNYDEEWGEISFIHRSKIMKFLSLLPDNPYILDAACGTGKYWQILSDKGAQILGIDHSSEMLKNAKQKFPQIQTKICRLQDIEYDRQFDGIICVDAMENVFPEHWPLILNLFKKALIHQGLLYLTVELLDREELEINYEENKEKGLPVVLGEHMLEGGYHYYPSDNQVKEWILPNFEILDQDIGDEYGHYILRKISS